MLGCIVLGEENAFPVDFDTNKTIGHLKGAIKEQAGLAELAHKLILWRVNIPENEKHEICEGINIEEKFGGEKLVSDLKTIGQEFKKQPPSEHIHIIVELPATTGKCLPMVYLSNKKFAVTKYNFEIVSSHWTKTIRRFRYIFATKKSLEYFTFLIEGQ